MFAWGLFLFNLRFAVEADHVNALADMKMTTLAQVVTKQHLELAKVKKIRQTIRLNNGQGSHCSLSLILSSAATSIKYVADCIVALESTELLPF